MSKSGNVETEISVIFIDKQSFSKENILSFKYFSNKVANQF